MKLKNIHFILPLMFLAFSCKKNNLVVDKESLIPPANFEFLVSGSKTEPLEIPIRQSGAPIAIPVAITNVGTSDRSISFTYTSTSGATNGTHFTAPVSFTMKAGKSWDSLYITGNYSDYASGRVDDLLLKVAPGSMPAVYGKDTIYMRLQKYCDPDLTLLSGTFDDTNEYNASNVLSYGPYTTSVIDLTSVDATSAKGKFVNLYDDNWNDIEFTMNWIKPGKFKVEIASQLTGGSAASLVTTSSTRASTFNSCDNTYTLYIDLKNPTTGAATATAYKIVLKKM